MLEYNVSETPASSILRVEESVEKYGSGSEKTGNLLLYPEDEGSKFLRNVSNDLPDCMGSHARSLIFIVTAVRSPDLTKISET